ncbi:MAG: zinc ABC transporter substrate-binding protein [Candidatus Dormiibacterota bacterium]
MTRSMAISKPVLTAVVLAVGVSAGQVGAVLAAPTSGKIVAVGAENEYSNVIAQVGGSYVKVASILSNPNTDPHSFEASPAVAELVGAADLVVQNGLGYDSFMNKIEAASPNQMRHVIDVRRLLGLPASTANPHLWYKPTTMPAVAKAVAAVLGKLAPSHATYFRARAQTFDASLTPWYHAIAQLKERFPHVPVAVTEPVGDYLLQAVGAKNRTPWTLQADIMNGVDPAPQAVSFQDGLFSHHKVEVFLYNQQVTDSLTDSFLALAKQRGIPVVGLYETMPSPGYDYQSWMMAETKALNRALADKKSTVRL